MAIATSEDNSYKSFAEVKVNEFRVCLSVMVAILLSIALWMIAIIEEESKKDQVRKSFVIIA
jgi:hypothetical protein